MVVNILMGGTALYRVEEFYENLDVPVLFGLDASASDFNDFTLARTLDKIFDKVSEKVGQERRATRRVAALAELLCRGCPDRR